ncbi:MAG: hypothetical protein OHK0017_05590 [Patescibacteria group bacterium]
MVKKKGSSGGFGGFGEKEKPKSRYAQDEPLTSEQIEAEKRRELEKKEARKKETQELLLPVLEVITTPEFIDFSLFIISEIKQHWIKKTEELKQIQHKITVGGYRARGNLEFMHNRMAMIESSEWLVLNYAEYIDKSKESQTAYCIQLAEELASAYMVVFTTYARNFSSDTIFPDFPKDKSTLQYSLCLSLFSLVTKASEILLEIPGYPNLQPLHRSFQRVKEDYFMQAAKYDMEISESDLDENGEYKSRNDIESVYRRHTDFNDSSIAYVYASFKREKNPINPGTEKKIEWIKKLPQILTEFYKIFGLEENKQPESSKLSTVELSSFENAYGIQIIRDIKKFSLPKLQGLLEAIQTGENNGYWSDLMDSLESDSPTLKPNQLSEVLKNKLIGTLQSEIVIKLNRLVNNSEAETSTSIQELLEVEVEDCLKKIGEIEQAEMLNLVTSFDQEECLSKEPRLLNFLRQLQGNTGFNLIFEIDSKPYLSQWFKFFKDHIIQALEPEETVAFSNAEQFLEQFSSGTNPKFIVENNAYTKQFYDKSNKKLQRLLIQRLSTIQQCGSIGAFRSAVASQSTIGFGWHLANRDQSWCQKGDVLIDCGAAVRLILAEDRESNTITIRGVVDYHDLNY